MSKFTSTVCTATPVTRQYRSDIGPLASQFDQVTQVTKDLKKVHHHQATASQHKSKDDHTKMLLVLLGEASHFHRCNTGKHICKIDSIRCQPTAKYPAGLSLATMKALVTDIDIVMNDDDKDNYQHALSAVAALSIWH